MNAKRFVTFVCACSMAMLLSPSDAAAQRRGGGGDRGGQPAARPRDPATTAVPRSGPRPGGSYWPYYRPYYRPYYGSYYRPYYRPYYYSPYWYNGFYASVYFGMGWYPYYAGYYGYGYPSAYYGYYGYDGYQWGYPYPRYYGYGAWSSIRLEVKPRDAQVFVDGFFVGMVDDFDGVFQRLDLAPGEHEIAVYMPGFQTYHERTLFRPRESYHFKAILQPLPPGAPQDPKPQPAPNAQPNRPGDPNYGGDVYPQGPYRQPPPGDPGRTQPLPERPRGNRGPENAAGFGTLNLRVQPADAIVQIDGERWDSPEGGSRLVVQLAVGPHRLEVRKEGFRPYSTTIEIRAGEPQTLNVVLPQQN